MRMVIKPGHLDHREFMKKVMNISILLKLFDMRWTETDGDQDSKDDHSDINASAVGNVDIDDSPMSELTAEDSDC
jgi:hypothetical protein